MRPEGAVQLTFASQMESEGLSRPAPIAETCASKEPPDKGGWNIFITNLTSLTNVFVPAHIGITGGPGGWFGWPEVPRLDALRAEWLNAATVEEQKKIATDIQVQFFRDVTHVPLGQFFQPAAFNKKLAGIQPGWPVMHSVRLA